MKKYITFLLIMFLPFIVFAENIVKDYELKLNDSDFNINSYFSISDNNVTWIVSDPSVASVVEGNIIPIKAGSTIIKANIGNNDYILNLEVVNLEKKVVNTNKNINQVMEDVNVKNPKTGDALILLTMIVSLSLVTSIFISIIMKNNKYEGE